LEKAIMFTFNGEATSVTPKMQVMFMKPLLTMLPNAISKCPFRVAARVVSLSLYLVVFVGFTGLASASWKELEKTRGVTTALTV
jgi:hypothetical protein